MIIGPTYDKELYWDWNLHLILKPLVDVNFNGVQDDDTDNRHDESGIVRLCDVFEDVDVRLKLKIKSQMTKVISG